MVSHMKTTVQIADDLFDRAQRVAREENTTFRALTEEGLRMVLQERRHKKRKLPPLPTVGGEGLAPEFSGMSWEAIRDEVYRGRGA